MPKTIKGENVVLITSALHTRMGIYSAAERIVQTLDSIASVRQYVPDCRVILIENGLATIRNETNIHFRALLGQIDFYLDNSSDTTIMRLHEAPPSHHDVAKNLMESTGMLNALLCLRNSQDPRLRQILSGVRRYFKLSGRYQINRHFEIDKFRDGLYGFARRSKSWIPAEHTGVDYLYETRLWHFPASCLDETVQLYRTIVDHMENQFSQGRYIDIEHSMAKFIPADRVLELSPIGVSGQVARNGVLVSE